MIKMETPVKPNDSSRANDTLLIDGMRVHLAFSPEENVQVANMVRETLKESYNRRLTA